MAGTNANSGFGSGNTPPVSPSQGNPGGTGQVQEHIRLMEGGGGGAGGANGWNLETIRWWYGGAGAATTSITGSPVTRGGGGGGG